jgi:hypothetical protein
MIINYCAVVYALTIPYFYFSVYSFYLYKNKSTVKHPQAGLQEAFKKKALLSYKKTAPCRLLPLETF